METLNVFYCPDCSSKHNLPYQKTQLNDGFGGYCGVCGEICLFFVGETTTKELRQKGIEYKEWVEAV